MKSKRGHKTDTRKHETPVCEKGQLYARVTKMLGNGRILATCVDGVERMCKIRGSMRKREWVKAGDTVLVALRDFQDNKADVVYRYQEHEVQRLKRQGEDVAVVTPTDEGANDEYVTFDTEDTDDVDVDLV